MAFGVDSDFESTEGERMAWVPVGVLACWIIDDVCGPRFRSGSQCVNKLGFGQGAKRGGMAYQH